jgi:hypothetical protein
LAQSRDLLLYASFALIATRAVEPIQLVYNRQRLGLQLGEEALKILCGYFPELVVKFQLDDFAQELLLALKELSRLPARRAHSPAR